MRRPWVVESEQIRENDAVRELIDYSVQEHWQALALCKAVQQMALYAHDYTVYKTTFLY